MQYNNIDVDVSVKFEGDPKISESQLAVTIDEVAVRVICEPNNTPLIVADGYFAKVLEIVRVDLCTL